LSIRAARLDIGRHLLLGRGEEKSGGRRKLTLLADTYEALIAAIYLDGGLEAARGFVEREFGPLLEDTGAGSLPGDDYKSALQELLQARGRPLPDYIVADETGPAHHRLFRIDLSVAGDVLARGEGRTKKEAEQEAARLALEEALHLATRALEAATSQAHPVENLLGLPPSYRKQMVKIYLKRTIDQALQSAQSP